jgi:hypothetical protein
VIGGQLAYLEDHLQKRPDRARSRSSSAKGLGRNPKAQLGDNKNAQQDKNRAFRRGCSKHRLPGIGRDQASSSRHRSSGDL